MFETTQDLITFVEDFSNLANPPYIKPYLDDALISDFERKLGQSIPPSFRELLLIVNFDDFQFGTTMFGDGKNKFLDYILAINEEFDDYLKIAVGEMGGIFISMKSGEVWSQYVDGDVITQTKLAENFRGFFEGYAFIQKNRMERASSLEDLAKFVAKEIGSDNDEVWLHSML